MTASARRAVVVGLGLAASFAAWWLLPRHGGGGGDPSPHELVAPAAGVPAPPAAPLDAGAPEQAGPAATAPGATASATDPVDARRGAVRFVGEDGAPLDALPVVPLVQRDGRWVAALGTVATGPDGCAPDPAAVAAHAGIDPLTAPDLATLALEPVAFGTDLDPVPARAYDEPDVTIPGAGTLVIRIAREPGAAHLPLQLVLRGTGHEVRYQRTLHDVRADVLRLPALLHLAGQLSVAAADRSRTVTQTAFTGPARDGEVVEVAVAVGEPVPVLLARLEDEAGAPYPETRLEVRAALRGLEREDDALEWVSIPVVTRDGALVRIPTFRPPSGSFVRLDITDPASSAYAQLDLPEPLAPVEVHLGTVVLRPQPVAVRGHVRVAPDRSLRLAQVRLDGTDGDGRRIRIDAPLCPLGSYALRTRLTGPFTLTASARDSVSQTRPVELPVAEPVDFDLEPAVAAELELLFEAQAHAWLVYAEATCGSLSRTVDVPGSGRIRLGGFPPACSRFEIRVLSSELGWELASADYVVGQDLTLDLRGRVQVFSRVFTDEAGSPLRGVNAEVESDDGRWANVSLDGEGRLRVALPVGIHAITVTPAAAGAVPEPLRVRDWLED